MVWAFEAWANHCLQWFDIPLACMSGNTTIYHTMYDVYTLCLFIMIIVIFLTVLCNENSMFKGLRKELLGTSTCLCASLCIEYF